MLANVLLNAQSIPGEIRTESKPVSATVYLSGARVNALCNVSLQKGNQTFVIENLSNQVDQNSIMVKTEGETTILSHIFRFNYLKPQEKKEYKKLEDSLSLYRSELKKIHVLKFSYDEEIAMLQQNRSIAGKTNSMTSAELSKMADFFRTRMNETGLKKIEAEEKEIRLTERIQAIEQQINDYKNIHSNPTGEIVVSVQSPMQGNVAFTISYFVNNCGWTPLLSLIHI